MSELGRYNIYLKLITQDKVLSYWHMLENEPSNLLKSAYEEYKSLYRLGYTDTWYSTVNFFCKTLNIDMNVSKTFGRNKFKNELKKTLKHTFLSYWNNIKQNQGESYKLSTYICLHCTLNEVEDESHMLFQFKQDLPQKNTLN